MKCSCTNHFLPLSQPSAIDIPWCMYLISYIYTHFWVQQNNTNQACTGFLKGNYLSSYLPKLEYTLHLNEKLLPKIQTSKVQSSTFVWCSKNVKNEYRTLKGQTPGESTGKVANKLTYIDIFLIESCKGISISPCKLILWWGFPLLLLLIIDSVIVIGLSYTILYHNRAVCSIVIVIHSICFT